MRPAANNVSVPSLRQSTKLRSGAAWLAIVALASVMLSVAAAPIAGAHAPHDQVTDIDFPSDYEESGWLLALIRGRLMRSPDRGMTWHEIVRGFGGEAQKVREVDISFTDPSVVYGTSREGEVLRSDDTGLSWTELPAPDGMVPSDVTVSGSDPDIVFLANVESDMLARSLDGGQTWETIQRNESDVRPLAVAVMAGTDRVFVASTNDRFLTSDDHGDTWEVVRSLSGARLREMTVAAPFSSSPVVFGGSESNELWRSDDLGETFRLLGDGLPDEQIFSIATSPGFADDQTLWVSTRLSGSYRSTDGGETFSLIREGLTRSPQADNVSAPHFTTVSIAPDGSGATLLAGFDGLFLLAPDGERWTSVETLTGYIAGLDVSPNYANDQTLIVNTYVRGSFLSTDGGTSWEFVNEGLLVPAPDEGNRFAPIRRLHGVHFSPTFAEDNTIWSANWVRVLRTTNGAEHWEDIPVGEQEGASALRQFVLAPSPAYADDDTLYAGTRQGEFFRSVEFGAAETWQLLSTFDTRIRSIAPSPAISDDNTIFVGTVGGLFRSVDGGDTWIDTGVRNDADVTGREIDVGIQVAVSPDYASDGLVVATTDTGLFQSEDAGVTFTKVQDGPLEGKQLIEAVAFSPTFASDGLLLASVRGVGLIRSTDAGDTWTKTGDSLDELNLLIADYANPTSSAIQFSPTFAEDRTIYAFAEQALIRSTDEGTTWTEVSLPSAADVIASLPDFDPVGDDSLLNEDRDVTPPGEPEAPSDGGSSNRATAAWAFAALLVVGGAGLLAWRRSKR